MSNGDFLVYIVLVFLATLTLHSLIRLGELVIERIQRRKSDDR